MKAHRTDAGLQIDLDDEAETERLGPALAQIVVPNVVIGLSGPLARGRRGWPARSPKLSTSTPRRSPVRRSC